VMCLVVVGDIHVMYLVAIDIYRVVCLVFVGDIHVMYLVVVGDIHVKYLVVIGIYKRDVFSCCR
jgi:hypothetical protein